jgi:hypothetical protein
MMFEKITNIYIDMCTTRTLILSYLQWFINFNWKYFITTNTSWFFSYTHFNECGGSNSEIKIFNINMK